MNDIKTGQNYHFENAQFYAANGTIVWHDDRPGKEDCKFISIRDFETRARALAEQLKDGRLQADFSPGAIEHRRKLGRLLHDVDCCIKEAKSQGDPLSPEVQAWYARHKPWLGNRVSGAGRPGGETSYEVNTPPPLADLRGPDTGVTDRE